tara:strand:- start:3848 stop:4681 length:834 start_codon:yes stop_codon:yes gene_type:complete
MAKRKLSPKKAQIMLDDGMANKKPLTAKQKKYFKMVANTQDGGEVGVTTDWLNDKPKEFIVIDLNTGKVIKNSFLSQKEAEKWATDNGYAVNMDIDYKNGGLVLVHAYEKDGNLYGTGTIESVKGGKTVVRFDSTTTKVFDSKNVKPVMENGGKMAASLPYSVSMAKGGEVKTWKDKYNEKYGFEKGKSHSLKDIAKTTGISMKGIQQIYDKGIGAYKTNPQSVRPNVKSKEQWAYGRVYSAVMGGKAAKVDAKELKMEKGGGISGYFKGELSFLNW